jgi:hypothetical protein
MTRARDTSRPFLPPLALVAALGACAGVKSGAGGLSGSGTGGSTGSNCTVASCVPRVYGALMLAVEIDPPAGSDSGLTELSSDDIGLVAGPLALVADSQVTLPVTFNTPSDVAIPSNANLLLDVPSTILGRPDLTFQAPASVLATSGSGTPAATAQLNLPEGPIRRMAGGTLSLIPLSPADQQSPPHSASTVVYSTGAVGTLPSDDFSITGTLLDAVATPRMGVVARAFQAGTQVSSAPLTAADGSYRLEVPTAVAAGGPLTIQLAPQSPNDALFVFDPITLPTPLPMILSVGTVKTGAYQNANQFNVLVVATDTMQSPVSGAIVQMQTNLGTNPSTAGQPPYMGTTLFARSATTDAQGKAAISLLPGNNNASVDYTAVVVPPVGSLYATTCFPKVGAGAGGGTVSTPSAPTIGPLQLSPRAVMSGRLTDPAGRPVANVAVTATPGSDAVNNCTATPAAPASTTSDAQGNFSLPLDPGTASRPVAYQLDYVPPAGSAVPRTTEVGIVVGSSAAFSHDVTLPPGGLVTGTVTDSNQNVVPSATVRLFQPRCSSSPCPTPPWLRGQGVTDANGNFQIVVPLQQ